MIVHGVQASEVAEIEERAVRYAGVVLLGSTGGSQVLELGLRWLEQEESFSSAFKHL